MEGWFPAVSKGGVLRMRMKLMALVGGAVLAVAAPSVANASTKKVYLGPPPKDEKTFNEKYGSDVDDFFPHGITVHVGNSVSFVPANFHTVNFPKKGVHGPLPLIAPTGQKVAGVSDAGANAFWFNGQDEVGFNPALFPVKFGKTEIYDGKAMVESGPPVVPNPKPFTVKFARRGTFTYYCDVHPGMKGVVHVVAKRAKAPTARDDAWALRKQVKRDLKLAAKAAKAKPGGGQVYVGYEAGHGVEYFGFLPGGLTVPRGTTLTFTMSKGSLEDHTATFGPGDPLNDPGSYLGQIAASFNGPGPFDPRAIYPSELPGTPASFTASSHGNGFWNSGVLDTLPATPLPSANAVTFNEDGAYNYYCMIHPFMHGTITVTG
jgi:plastocyanin